MKILADTSIWVDHLRHGNVHMSSLLAAALIGRLQLWTLDQALRQAAGECGCALAVH